MSAKLRAEFGDDFSCSAFEVIDGELQIVGRFGRISRLNNGAYDVWFVGRNLAPLTKRKLTALRTAMPQEAGFRILDGEAIVQGRGRDFVIQAASLAGVKRKRRVGATCIANLRNARLNKRISLTFLEGRERGN